MRKESRPEQILHEGLEPGPLECEPFAAWTASGSRVFMLEPAVCVGLAFTEPLAERFNELPKLPVNAFFVQMPDEIADHPWRERGEHTVYLVGFYIVVRDEPMERTSFIGKNDTVFRAWGSMYARIDRSRPLTAEDEAVCQQYERYFKTEFLPWTIEVTWVMRRRVSESDGKTHTMGRRRVAPGEDYVASGDEQSQNVDRLIVNLITALTRTRYVQERKIVPIAPASTKKAAKLQRANYSFRPYSLLRLDTTTLQIVRQRTVSGGASLPAGQQRAHVVLGHWHRYWRATVGPEDAPDMEKPGRGRPLYRVLKWIAPYVRGEGELDVEATLVRRWWA